MKRFLTLLILSSLSSVIFAKPVYLRCEIEVDEQMKGFTVTLNEETRKIDHKYDAGALLQADGVFTVDAVTYEDTMSMAIGTYTTKFRIDRVDLSVVRISALVITNPLLQDEPQSEPSVNSGTCKVMDVPKRQF